MSQGRACCRYHVVGHDGAAARTALDRNPMEVVRRYELQWATDLGGLEKPWTWLDAAKSINWGKYRWMFRVFVMLGACKRHLEQARGVLPIQGQRCEAQLVQCMKSIHQFGIDGNWAQAWEYTRLPDPAVKRPYAGEEAETEVILSALRTRQDLRRRLGQQPGGAQEDDDGGDKADRSKGNGKADKAKK